MSNKEDKFIESINEISSISKYLSNLADQMKANDGDIFVLYENAKSMSYTDFFEWYKSKYHFDLKK